MSDPEASYLQRACPTCGAASPDPAWRMSSEPPAETCPLSELQSSWRGFFKDGKHFFTYRRCAACGQVYCPQYFTSDQLAELYRHMEDNTAGLPEALMAKTQRDYFRLLRHADFKPGGYLELGPDIGLFTREVISHPAFSTYWMVEPNESVHPALDRLLGEKSRILLNDSAQVDQVPDASLSLIVAIHVLDHLPEPQPLLDRLMAKLQPGGWFLAVTHNQSSLMARVFGRRWPPYCLQHPQLYSSASLSESLTRAGLGSVSVTGTVNYFPVTYLLRHFFFAAGLGRIPVPQWDSWSIGLKLGNIAAIGQKT